MDDSSVELSFEHKLGAVAVVNDSDLALLLEVGLVSSPVRRLDEEVAAVKSSETPGPFLITTVLIGGVSSFSMSDE